MCYFYCISYLICIHIYTYTCYYIYIFNYINIISCYPFPPGDIQIHIDVPGFFWCKMRFYSGGVGGHLVQVAICALKSWSPWAFFTRPPFGRDPATLVQGWGISTSKDLTCQGELKWIVIRPTTSMTYSISNNLIKPKVEVMEGNIHSWG